MERGKSGGNRESGWGLRGGLTVDGVADEEEDDDEVSNRGRARFGSFEVSLSVSRNRVNSSALLRERALGQLSYAVAVSAVLREGGESRAGAVNEPWSKSRQLGSFESRRS